MSPEQWQVTVKIPADLPEHMHTSLFTAVVEAVEAWEPEDRDGWDTAITGGPVSDEAWFA